MQLAIDIGNTATKFGLFKGNELLKAGASEKEPVFLIKEIYEANPGIEALVISSVNQQIDPDLIPIPETIHHLIIDSETPLPFENTYKSPLTFGHDRIALVAGGLAKFPNQNVLILDIGTCLTMEVLNDKGQYLGGIISPGLNLRFSSLNSGTARLPKIDIPNLFPNWIGKSTQECIESGVMNGLLFEIKGAINHMKSQFSNLKVVLTGGHAKFFENELKSGIFADPNLVLRGLHEILRYNLDK